MCHPQLPGVCTVWNFELGQARQSTIRYGVIEQVLGLAHPILCNPQLTGTCTINMGTRATKTSYYRTGYLLI